MDRPWPTTIAEAVDRLLAALDEQSIQQIRSCERSKLAMYHFFLGTYIRNQFGLWAGNHQLLHSCNQEFAHPDDVSMKIIDALWQRLQEEPSHEKR